jgi:hypothetical protein
MMALRLPTFRNCRDVGIKVSFTFLAVVWQSSSKVVVQRRSCFWTLYYRSCCFNRWQCLTCHSVIIKKHTNRCWKERGKVTLLVTRSQLTASNRRFSSEMLVIKSECLYVIQWVSLNILFCPSTGRVRFPAGAGNFSPHHRVQNGSGAHQASYTKGTRGSFPGGKAAAAWSWPLTPSGAEVKNAWSYTSTPPIRLRGGVLS